jgi:hypothetical protein
MILRLLLAPALIAGASLAGRRWGGAVSGWIVGLPLTSGPIAIILALQYGPAFAATAAFGTMAGALTQGAFALAYSGVARRAPWSWAFVAACAAFAAATAVFRFFDPAPLVSYGVVVAGLAIVITLLRPRVAVVAVTSVAPPRSDLPIRMLLAAGWVLLLTGIAPSIGAGLAGMLSPFPMYGAILTVFAHRERGADEATHVLCGMLYGLFGFATFFLCEGMLLERFGIGAAFGAAIASALLLQAGALWLLRRNSRPVHTSAR